MIKHFGVRKAISTLALAALAAFSTLTPTPISTPTHIPSPTTKLTDFTFLLQAPIPLNSNFAIFLGPGIWERVPAGGRTYDGNVEYLVEALNAGGNVITSYNGEFTRPKQDVSGNRPTLSELVTLLIATQSQITNPVPLELQSNPRYMIPPNASAVRVTIDPDDKIEELDEKNNTFLLGLPAIYRDF